MFLLKSNNNNGLHMDISIDFKNLSLTEEYNEDYTKKINIRPEILCKIIKREFLWSMPT